MTNDQIIDRSFHNTCIAGDFTRYASIPMIKKALARASIETDQCGNIVAIDGQRVIDPPDLGGCYTFEEPATVGAFWDMADMGL